MQVQESQELINNLNDRPPINQDFDNVDDMATRLCMVNIYVLFSQLIPSHDLFLLETQDQENL